MRDQGADLEYGAFKTIVDFVTSISTQRTEIPLLETASEAFWMGRITIKSIHMSDIY